MNNDSLIFFFHSRLKEAKKQRAEEEKEERVEEDKGVEIEKKRKSEVLFPIAEDFSDNKTYHPGNTINSLVCAEEEVLADKD